MIKSTWMKYCTLKSITLAADPGTNVCIEDWTSMMVANFRPLNRTYVVVARNSERTHTQCDGYGLRHG